MSRAKRLYNPLLKNLTCPLCGSHVWQVRDSETLVRCADRECPAHKQPLKLFVDREGIASLAETV